MNLIYYHKADLDGRVSGMIAKYYMEKNNKPYKLIPIDYGEEMVCKIAKEDNVYMLDWVIQPNEKVKEIERKCKQLFIIDHHKSFLVWRDKNKYVFAGMQMDFSSACYLTWQWFIQQPIPEFIKLLSDYDIWNNKDKEKWDKEILPFQYGMRLHNDEEIYELILDMDMTYFKFKSWEKEFICEITKKGNTILQYERQSNEKIMDNLSYEKEWEGYRCLICNCGGSSQYFESKYDPEKHDIMISYRHVKGKYFTVSFYTTKKEIDVSLLAKKYKGGGHRGASGAQCNELPWLK